MAKKFGAECGNIKIYSKKRAAMKIRRDHDSIQDMSKKTAACSPLYLYAITQ
jgi:hypothetical protein